MKSLLILLLLSAACVNAAVGPGSPSGTVIPGGSTNVALLNGTNVFSGTNTFSRVGIGTNSPKSSLHISSSETNSVLQVVGATNQLGNLIEARSGSLALKFAVNPSGDLGIGASPTRPLYLLDNTQGGFRMERTTATARAWDFYVASDGSFNFYDGSGGGNRMTINTAGVVSYPTAINVGSGANVTAILSATATLDFDLSSAIYEDKSITVSGAQSGDCVIVGATASAVGTSVAYFAWVNAPNSVGIRAYRLGAGEDPPSQAYRVTVIRH